MSRLPPAKALQPAANKPPTLEHGSSYTPAVLEEFRRFVVRYQANKGFTDDEIVSRICHNIADPRIETWVSTQTDHVHSMSLSSFMKELRHRLLPIGWDARVQTGILRASQGQESFTDFASRLRNLNDLLRDSEYHFTDTSLRFQIEAGLNEYLRHRVRNDPLLRVAGPALSYDQWFKNCEAVARDLEYDIEQSSTAVTARLRERAVQRAAPSASNTQIANRRPTQTSSGDPALAPLTDTERDLLWKYRGCYRCRRFAQAHTSSSCPHGPPAAATYRPLTEASVPATAKTNARTDTRPPPQRTRARPTAAVTESHDNDSTNPASNTTAAISPVDDNFDVGGLAAVIEDVASSVLEGSDASDSYVAPFSSSHLFWNCHVDGPSSPVFSSVSVRALIDHGSHIVLIDSTLVDSLGLRRFTLNKPFIVTNAMSSTPNQTTSLSQWVKIRPRSIDGLWTSRTLRAIVASNLAAPIILGGPFLSVNRLVIDHELRSCVPKDSTIDLLAGSTVSSPAPSPVPSPVSSSTSRLPATTASVPATSHTATPVPSPASVSTHNKPRATPLSSASRRLVDAFARSSPGHTLALNELKSKLHSVRRTLDSRFSSKWRKDAVAAVRARIETLASAQQAQQERDDYARLDAKLKNHYLDRFPSDIPHTDLLPTDVYHRFRLRDAAATIKTRSYSCPRKYRDAWKTLLDQHIAQGRLRPSSAPAASPAFLIPKADPTALPRWVNDYRQLNSNTVPDSYPLPRIDDILNACAKGKIWAKLDMTNSFFQTRVHPDDVHLTAVTTPFGNYEWTVMPQGCRNAPATHQRRMNQALRHLIGKICHVYLDDIIIWSQNVREHIENVRKVMDALRDAQLFCSLKKTELFCSELKFLGHIISQRGIEADPSKIDKILSWPTPRSASDVRSFLGLVRYISAFLPRLAEHTAILTPLTTKDAQASFPSWSPSHQRAFDSIKALVTSRECLTTINHQHLGSNRVFVTTDASGYGTGAMLSVGTTWESSRPVAFDSIQLKGAELNYPVHEKELLAIIRALKKWRSDLLGIPFEILTDHRTLENFETQRDLSRRQARWQETLSHYDFKIKYIKGEDNTVADALSRLPPPPIPYAVSALLASDLCPLLLGPVCSILNITSDTDLLSQIRDGYKNDKFACKLLSSPLPTLNVSERDGLLFIGDRLVIPRVSRLRELLFNLAHDSLGHFGFDKAYESLCASYYWPNMRRDLESTYIPSCDACQRNKSSTKRPPGPLHPLPVPLRRFDSVAIDFVGPLPEDQGFNCLVTMTDRLGADIKIVPCRTEQTAEHFASLFFDHWYCDNGLPLEIVSDRDRLFTSRFWKALHLLSGVKLKMSTAFHPETDGSSERTNKTVVQALRYHVSRNQRGWVRALPRVRFDIMNTLNTSTGFSPFQLKTGQSPRIIPPLIPPSLVDAENLPDDQLARHLLRQIELDVDEAQDNLLLAKVSQAIQADRHRGPDPSFQVGDYVMLNTLHRRRAYAQAGDQRVAKFMPRWDGKYKVIRAFPESSSYTLHLPQSPNVFPTFHASELRPYNANDPSLFPSREHPRPAPVVTPDGQEEWLVDKIVDQRRRGRGLQYLVQWQGYPPDEQTWLPRRELEHTEALDRWIADLQTD